MEAAGAVGARIAMRAEGIALRLDEVRARARGAVAVEISQGRGERGNGDAIGRRRGDDAPPGRRSALEARRESRRDQQINRPVPARRSDRVEETPAEDAAAAPDPGDAGKVELPAILGLCR